ncbi:MAG: DUF2919 family protein [Aeromonadaceae bacterium]
MHGSFTHLDLNGEHHLPWALHLCLLALMRSYILLLLALASQQQSATLLALFYPDPHQLYWGLALGAPAALCWLASAYRQRAEHPLYHRIWRFGRPLCLLSALGELWLQLNILAQHAWQFSWPQACSLGLGIWCVSYLLLASGLKRAFITPYPTDVSPE